MKKKMLYLSHIDWKWIKQRPQFIAEELKAYFDVSVLYTFQNKNRKALQKRSLKGQDVKPFFILPLANRIKPIKAINKPFMKGQLLHHIQRVKPDYIYLTYPNQIEALPESCHAAVIYDCMDDHVAMTLDSLRETLKEQEKRLFQRADAVLVSSENLRRVLMNRYGADAEKKIHLIRNGYSGEILKTEPPKKTDNKEFTIAYVGTVGQWFNMDFVKRSVQDIPNLRYRIVGPVEQEKPVSDRIEFPGTVEHDRLYDIVRDTDCLVMPFVVNDIIASVDPVKLYEYINFNKNILCVKYDEIQRFEPFVHFYEDYPSYLENIRSMMKDNTVKYSNSERESFLRENNWSGRVKEIAAALENMKK